MVAKFQFVHNFGFCSFDDNLRICAEGKFPSGLAVGNSKSDENANFAKENPLSKQPI
jgi:hypothetical protein